MHYHVERWAARPAWRALRLQDRISYLDQMGTAFERLGEAGGRLVGVVLTDKASADGLQYRAVWAMRDGAPQVRLLDTILEAFGWEAYFRPAGTGQTADRDRRSFFEYVQERDKAGLKSRDDETNGGDREDPITIPGHRTN